MPDRPTTEELLAEHPYLPVHEAKTSWDLVHRMKVNEIRRRIEHYDELVAFVASIAFIKNQGTNTRTIYDDARALLAKLEGDDAD